MIHTWRQRCLDFIFPPSESLLILRAFSDISPLSFYQPTYPNGIIALSHYNEPYIKANITAGKFEHNEPALKNLGLLLQQHLHESVTTWRPEETIFVPIPLHRKRQAKRGYNQVDVLLKSGLRGTNFHTYQLLERIKNTSPQSHLTRTDRLPHLKDAFIYRSCAIDWNNIKQVVLVDDVITTGSTLEAGANVLRSHLPKNVSIIMLAFAH